jgi:hypothetical protein
MTMSFESLFTLPLLNDNSARYLSISWVPDAKLRRNIHTILKQTPEATLEDLVRIFLVTLKNDPDEAFHRKHLAAFTSRIIEKVVRKLTEDLDALESFSSVDNKFFKDFFQSAIIRTLEADPEKDFYKSLDIDKLSESFWLPSLKSYIKKHMEGLLWDEIRKFKGSKTYKRSALYLVRHASKKGLIEALIFFGFRDNKLIQLILLYQCYKENYERKSKSKKVKNHTLDDDILPGESFQVTADRYNQLRLQLPISEDQNLPLSANEIEPLLKEIGGYIRRYVDRQKLSLDMSLPSQNEDNSTTLLEQEADLSIVTETNLLSFNEIHEEIQAVKQFLDDVLDRLGPEESRIPILLIGVGLAEKKIGEEIGRNQSNVNRQYKKFVLQILRQLGDWAKNHQGWSVDSETLNIMKPEIEEHIKQYYSTLISNFFTPYFNVLSLSTRELLRTRYQASSYIFQDGYTPNPARAELGGIQLEAVKSLQEGIQESIEERMNLRLKPEVPIEVELLTLTEVWLETAPYEISI